MSTVKNNPPSSVPPSTATNFGDASSIEKGNPAQAPALDYAYKNAVANPTNQDSVNVVTNNLFAAALSEGATLADVPALNAAATAALHSAGVSDASIAWSLGQVGLSSHSDHIDGFAQVDAESIKNANPNVSTSDVQNKVSQDLKDAGLDEADADTAAKNAASGNETP